MTKKKASKSTDKKLSLVATPYDSSAPFWYFGSAEEFDKKYKKHLPVEEYEIDFIGGGAFEGALFNGMKVGQHNLVEYFDNVEELAGMDEYQQAALYYALEELGIDDIGAAISTAQDDIHVSEGTAEDYVNDFIDGQGGVEKLDKKTLAQYFDQESFTRDMKLNGDVTEFTFAGKTWTTDYR